MESNLGKLGDDADQENTLEGPRVISYGMLCMQGALYSVRMLATKKFWTMLILLSGIIVFGVSFRLNYPDDTFSGASIPTWCLFFTIIIILRPVATMTTWVALIGLELSFGRIKMYRMKLYYLRVARPRISYLIWSIGVLVSWQTVFSIDPFPAYKSGSISTLNDDLWFVARFLWVNLAFSVLSILKIITMKYVSLGKRLEIYFREVEESIKAEEVLSVLTAAAPARMFTSMNVDANVVTRSRSQGEAAVKIQQFFRKFVARRDIPSSLGEPSMGEPASRVPGPDADAATSTPVKRTSTTATNHNGSGASRRNGANSTSSTSKLVGTTPSPLRDAGRKTSSASLERPLSPIVEPAPASPPLPTSPPLMPASPEYEPDKRSRVSLRRVASVRHERAQSPEDDDVNADILARVSHAEHVKKNFLRVCAGLRVIKTRADAKRLGEVVSTMYADDDDNDMVLIVNMRKSLASWKLFRTAHKLFDPYNQERVPRQTVVDTCLKVFMERKNLARSLHNLDSIVEALGAFLNGCIGVLLFFVAMISFSTGRYAELTLSLSTTIFAISFVFADSAKNAFQSFLFLFVRHPFDVGDRVLIHGEDDPSMWVQKMELLTTTFRSMSGGITTIPNFVLSDRRITNIKRSGAMEDRIVVRVSRNTATETLRTVEAEFVEHLGTYPSYFVASESDMVLVDLTKDGYLELEFSIMFRTAWQESMERHGVEYLPPVVTAKLIGPVFDFDDDRPQTATV